MIGFDIGGTKCAVTVGDAVGDRLEIAAKTVILTEHFLTPYAMLDKMCDAAKNMTDDFRKIGISCGGPLDSRRGVILSPPNLPKWDNVKVTEYIERKLGGKAALQNDANACAMAEWRYGAGKGTENMIFLTFGTGMGAGLILNGKIYTGASDMAGEVGHIRLSEFGPVGYGKIGSFEGFCSGGGIAQLGKTMAIEQLQMGKSVSYCKTADDLPSVTAKSIAEAAKAGNGDALRVYEVCGEKLGLGLSLLVDILNPEKIVIGSIFERSGELLKDRMMQVLLQEALPAALSVCQVVPSVLGDAIGDYAALSVAAHIL